MSQFQLYLTLGLEHILDVNGYDHILFVVALCAIYLFPDWRRVLILITAFTIGHSVTLALATLNLIRINPALIEFLIPVTILITALANIFRKERTLQTKNIHSNYFLAIFFGLIHGLGFSNYLSSLLGKDHNIITQLLAFNLGLEIGQVIIVIIFLAISFIFVDIFGAKKRDWRIITSSATAGIALMLMIDTKFW